MNEFCPRCGTARLGAFRFCRGCAFDFETAAPIGAPAGTPALAVVAAPVVAAGGTGRRFSNRAIFGTGLAVLVALSAIGSLQKTDAGSPTTALATATATATARPVAAATPTPSAEPASTPEPTFGPTGPTTEARVVRIVDGDTIVVAYGGQDYKVRYIGMDTPETRDPNTAIQWMGPQATVANALLVEGKTVFLEKDVSEVDRFDRLLRYVWLADGTAWTLVNLELVREGVAAATSYPPDVRYDALYQEAEGVARQSALGLWGPTPAPAAVAPTSKPKLGSTCHPSYTPCLPIVADLNCPAVRAMGRAPVTVIGPDDYRLDGNHDGIGCE